MSISCVVMYRVYALILSKTWEESIMSPLEAVKEDVDRVMKRIAEE